MLDALDQFHVKHLILFEGVQAPGVKDAFEKYAGDGHGKLHTAKIIGGDKPGEHSTYDIFSFLFVVGLYICI